MLGQYQQAAVRLSVPSNAGAQVCTDKKKGVRDDGRGTDVGSLGFRVSNCLCFPSLTGRCRVMCSTFSKQHSLKQMYLRDSFLASAHRR